MGRYLMDEACEVIDAIDSGSIPALKEELGICCFRFCFWRSWPRNREKFTLSDVMTAVGEK